MEYLSSSRIHLYNQCGLAFDLKYNKIVGIDDDTVNWYADYGTLHHGIYEDIANKRLFMLEEALRRYDSEFPKCNVPEKERSLYYQQGKEAVERKYKELNGMKILGVEVEFKFYIDFTMPPLYGFIDLVYEDEQGRLIVRDYKTSKVYGKSELDKQFQQYIYALACKQIFGKYPFKFEFDFVRFNETRDFIITERFIKLGIIKIKGVWNNMKTKPIEANYNPFFCSNFCENRSICPIYLKKNGS